MFVSVELCLKADVKSGHGFGRAFCRTGISANGKKTPRKATKGTAGKKDYK